MAQCTGRHQDHPFSKEFEMNATRNIAATAMIFIGGVMVGVGSAMVVSKQTLPITCTKLGIDTGKTLIEKFK